MVRFLFTRFSSVWLAFFPLSFYRTLRFELSLTCNRLFDSLRLRAKLAKQSEHNLMLHLGAGSNMIPGWVNVDACRSPGIDYVVDLRRRLPFQDNSVKYIFSEHVFEHFDYYEELPTLLNECFRILEIGGIMRVVVPDAEKCVEYYCSKDKDFFSFLSWPVYTPMEGLALVFTARGFHKFGYDYETLCLALGNAGFNEIYKTPYLGSSIAVLNLESKDDPRSAASLCVEAIKR